MFRIMFPRCSASCSHADLKILIKILSSVSSSLPGQGSSWQADAKKVYYVRFVDRTTNSRMIAKATSWNYDHLRGWCMLAVAVLISSRFCCVTLSMSFAVLVVWLASYDTCLMFATCQLHLARIKMRARKLLAIPVHVYMGLACSKIIIQGQTHICGLLKDHHL